MPRAEITIGDAILGNDRPLMIFGGMNVLESKELALEVAETFKAVCEALELPLVFKASFDKANRSSISSFRGPGLETGLDWLGQIREKTGLPVITDVHEPAQAAPTAEVCDVLQLPAFLSRQTDLVRALAETGKPVNVKKAQFLAAPEMRHIIRKFEDCGNDRVILCERGTMFGYNNLVVDMLNFGIMKRLGCPVIFDVTHALQLPGAGEDAAGGRGFATRELGTAGISQRIAGLFIEAHPDPANALCDGPSAVALANLHDLLASFSFIDHLVKREAQDRA